MTTIKLAAHRMTKTPLRFGHSECIRFNCSHWCMPFRFWIEKILVLLPYIAANKLTQAISF